MISKNTIAEFKKSVLKTYSRDISLDDAEKILSSTVLYIDTLMHIAHKSCLTPTQINDDNKNIKS